MEGGRSTGGQGSALRLSGTPHRTRQDLHVMIEYYNTRNLLSTGTLFRPDRPALAFRSLVEPRTDSTISSLLEHNRAQGSGCGEHRSVFAGVGGMRISQYHRLLGLARAKLGTLGRTRGRKSEMNVR